MSGNESGLSGSHKADFASSGDLIKRDNQIILSSSTSTRISLEAVKKGDHGTSTDCNVLSDSQLQKDLLDQKLKLFGHSHLAELIPEPSNNDRKFLWFIEQKESFVISAMTGICIQYQAL